MLVQHAVLFFPSASCFCQIPLATLIPTSQALRFSFIWQKARCGEDALRTVGRPTSLAGCFLTVRSCCSYRWHSNQEAVRRSSRQTGASGCSTAFGSRSDPQLLTGCPPVAIAAICPLGMSTGNLKLNSPVKGRNVPSSLQKLAFAAKDAQVQD